VALSACGGERPKHDAVAQRAPAPPERAATPAGAAARRRAADPSLAAISPEAAQTINAERPFDAGPIRPMRPFVLPAAGIDRARAVECLADAIYYEAAREPRAGQEAVAQVVLNRVRHPAYPKTVCGVVFQGSARATGCQFTFTCDGAMRWAPEPALWRRAEAVARRAVSGYVDKQVGSATHYHAVYVVPTWAPSLAKMTQVGQHIFYRWEGAWGEPPAFTGRYAGGEAQLSDAVLTDDAPTLREVTLKLADGTRTYKVEEASQPGEAPAAGVLRPTRRSGSPEQIRQINAHLAELERSLDGAAGTPSAASAGRTASALAP
jgi:spore germination cell wall hydrolase CwlJ-like protein